MPQSQLNIDDVINDAEEIKALPKTEKLASLQAMADNMREYELAIAQKEAELAALKDKLNQVTDIQIPELLDELGMDGFTLKNGIKLKVSTHYSGKITDQAAFTWLEKNHHSDIIKGEVEIAYPKGFDKGKLRMLVEAAKSVGLSANVGETVHPSTLRAWLKMCIESGEEIPRDLFNVTVFRRAKFSMK